MTTDTKRTPQDLAQDFLAMSPAEFNAFWMAVAFEWNIEDENNDIEAVWFLCGKHMKPSALTVISAMHSAVASGRKSADAKR